MRPGECEGEMLRRLAWTPLLDRLEMVCVSGWSRTAVYEAIRRLEDDGFVASIPHAADLTPPTRRYFLTPNGLLRLAVEEKATVDSLLRSRPVSAEWRRILLERLDAIAFIYRLASAIANADDHPVRLRLYRARPLDAAVMLPGGRTVGIVRQGSAADRTAFSKRLWRLGEGRLPGMVLVLASDEVRLRHSRRLLARTSVPALLALERDAALVGADASVWRPPTGSATLDLRRELKGMRHGGELPWEPPLSRATIPGEVAPEADYALPAILKPAEKRALDLVADWPWIMQRDMAGLLSLSEPRVSRLTNILEAFGLTTRPIEGSGRLALTDRGLGMLARRDRSSVGVARRRWSVSSIDPEGSDEWRNISGGVSRQLLRNIEHTAAIHAFIAALARQSSVLGWETRQIDPAHKASRHFRHDETQRSVNPDAYGVLSRGPVAWPFFLEWERRAVRPATMSERLAPYLRYYSSHRPTDDHGTRPHVLVVFDDDIAATHFLDIANREMGRTGVTVPLWVSHGEAVGAVGPLGRIWRTPGEWEPAHLPLGG